MKTTMLKAITRRTLRLSVLLVASCFGRLLASAAIITSVVETGGDGNPTAQWTGQTFTGPTIGTYTVGLFQEEAASFADRLHQWNGATAALPLPSYLLNNEYIMSRNDNRDNPSYRLDVTISQAATVYLLIDNRLSDGNNANPPTFGATNMQWVLDQGWQPVISAGNRAGNTSWPDEVGVDGGGDGVGPGVSIADYHSVYSKLMAAGTFSLLQANNASRNMYGVVVVPLAIVEPPPAPTGLSEFSQDSKVTLRWNAVAAASGYVIKRATVSGGAYSIIATNNLLSYVDTTVINGTVYYYVVSAINSAGESPDSAEIAAHPNIAPVVTAAGGTNQVLLAWNSLPGATSYAVSRSASNGGPYAVVASGIGTAGYLDTAVSGGSRYYYVVASTLTGGVPGGFSTQVEAITAPSNFTNATAEAFALTLAKVSFSRADQIVATVQIEKSLNGVDFTPLTNITASIGYGMDAGLAPSTTTYYRLQASNVTGFSSYTPVLAVETPASGIFVNFANGAAAVPPGYLQDIGELFGDRTNGYFYGWSTPAGTNITVDARLRGDARSPDLRYDTFNHMQKGFTTPGAINAVWEIEIPNGLYRVRAVSGDVTATDSLFQQSIEGSLTAIYAPIAGAWWSNFTNTVYVADGRLTITPGTVATNDKLNFVDIYPATPAPNTLSSNPASLVITQNRSASFSIAVSGGPTPYGVQWYFNNSPIAGANLPTYTIPLVQPSDEGDYYAVVTNAGFNINPATAVTSETAHLTVIADAVGPVIVSVGSLDGYSVGVCFDEIVDTSVIDTGALDRYNYTVNGGIPGILGVVLRPDHRSVQLILDGSGGPLAGAFEITAANIGDPAGNSATSSGTNTVMGLTARDIGAPALIGTNFVCDSETITLVGSGADIWGTADQFHFASKNVDGDFDARVRVVSLRGSNAVTKAVLMARADDTPGSPTVHLSVNPPAPGRNQFEPGQRLTAGGATASWGTNFVPSDIPNCWLRLTRSGATFRGFRSTNGVDWVLMAVANQVFASSIHVGLGITAHDNTLLATSVFSGFSVTAVTGTDLGVAKIAAQPVVPVGSNLTYTVTVTNHGPAGATGVTLTDPLPAGVTFVSVIASQGSCGQAAGVVTCSLGDLAVATSAQVTIVGTAATAGTKVNTATVTSAGTELNPADNSASASVTVPAPPRITTPVLSGGTAGFSIATEAGVTYMVYYKNSLADADWTLLTTISGDGTVKSVTDPGPLPPTRFYTVRP